MLSTKFNKEELQLLATAPRMAHNSRNAARIEDDPNPLFDDLNPDEPAWLDVKRRYLAFLRQESLSSKFETLRQAEAARRLLNR